MRRNCHILILIVGMEIATKVSFGGAVWQYVPGALKMSSLLPHLLEIHVEIFMNEIMYAWDLLQNDPRERVIGTSCR